MNDLRTLLHFLVSAAALSRSLAALLSRLFFWLSSDERIMFAESILVSFSTFVIVCAVAVAPDPL